MRAESANSDRVIAKIAARQHGLVTRDQLIRAGLRTSAISRRVKAGRLHRIYRGVYAVGHPRLSFRGRCMAAALACGEGAVTSHRSAAALWGALPEHPGPIHVTVPTTAGRASRPGILLHRSTRLDPAETTLRHGIPVTKPARTLADLRRSLSADAWQRLARKALDLGLIEATALGPDPDLTRSELERRFLALCRRHGLPRPEVNARVGRYEVDFLWRDRRLIVETDGFQYHGSREAFESDRARDVELQARGYRVLRFTYRQVRGTPSLVAASLRGLLGGVSEQGNP